MKAESCLSLNVVYLHIERAAEKECAEHKPPEGKKPGRDVPEHDCL